jgi:ATP-dependent Clp protease ATP-binding subunit ClpB
VDFKNTLIIMTSNIGTSYIADASIPMETRKKGVEQELKTNFKPEFLNRIDEVIIFNPLTKDNIRDIILIQLRDVAKRLAERGIHLDITKKALEFLIEQGFDPQFGARPLKRAIQRYLLNPLSVKLLSGKLIQDATISVNTTGSELTFN